MVILGLLLAGCASFPSRPESHPHLVVHKDGYPLTDGGARIDLDRFRAEVIPETLAKLDAYIEAEHSQGRKPQLLLYVHGGLTSYDDSIADIDRLVRRDGGRIRETNFYPVFLHWDSTLGSSVYDDLFEIRHGQRRPYGPLAYLTSPVQLVARLLEGLAATPVTVLYMLDTGWEAWGEEAKEGETISGEERTQYWLWSLPTLPTKILTLPLLVGYGKGGWEMMKRRIEQMMALEGSAEGGGRGALRIFLRHLRERREAPGQWRTASGKVVPAELSILGHSLGAMIINHVLRDFPDLAFDWIGYMGAAASIDDFRDSVVPYLRRFPAARFYGFSLALKDESSEGRPKRWAPLVYNGSLLVWIDQLYEPGLYPGHRRVGWWRNLAHVRVESVDRDLCRRMTFFKFPGEPGDPRRHGDFNDTGHFQRIIHMTAETWPEQCPRCRVYHPCATE